MEAFAGATSPCQVPSPHACGNPAAARLTVKYAPRFDYDGWMVINPAVFDGELVNEPMRRGLSYDEAERSTIFFNRLQVEHPANEVIFDVRGMESVWSTSGIPSFPADASAWMKR
jgi:hypothetical protein